jgi:hypothetical protein
MLDSFVYTIQEMIASKNTPAYFAPSVSDENKVFLALATAMLENYFFFIVSSDK